MHWSLLQLEVLGEMHSIKLLEVSDVYLRLHLLQEHRWSGAKKAQVSESDAILGRIGSGGGCLGLPWGGGRVFTNVTSLTLL